MYMMFLLVNVGPALSKGERMFATHRRKKHSRLRKDGIHATNQPLTVGKGSE